MRLYLGYCGFVAKLPRHSQLFQRILSRPNSKLLEEDKKAILNHEQNLCITSSSLAAKEFGTSG